MNGAYNYSYQTLLYRITSTYCPLFRASIIMTNRVMALCNFAT